MVVWGEGVNGGVKYGGALWGCVVRVLMVSKFHFHLWDTVKL